MPPVAGRRALKIRVLGSYGSRIPGHHTSSLLINDGLLLDAGTVTSALSLEQQLGIDDVLLTHAHLDHMVDLAFLADNVLTLRSSPVRVWAPQPVLDTVGRHLFNDEVWPDFTRLPSPEAPAIRLNPLLPDRETEIQGLKVRWVRTRHSVFSAGYCLSDGAAAVLFSGDTAATQELWQMGSGVPGLRAAFIETSFPNRLAELAKASGHLTPSGLKQELQKLDCGSMPIKILHMKPQFLDEIIQELNHLGDDRLQILRGGEEFLF